MSNHFSGPDFRFPNGDARLDICDMYVFPNPSNSDASILIMTVHPSVGFNPPGPTRADGFANDAIYEFNIDTDGDVVANTVYRVRFSPLADGAQSATVYRAEAPDLAAHEGEAIIAGTTVLAADAEVQIARAGQYRLFAGRRSDPFFGDVAGAMNGAQFTGSDTMADWDVDAIVLEVPNHALGPGPRVGVWATVRINVPDNDSGWIQVDRFGRPEIVNFYCQGDDKLAFNAAEPAHDRATFLDRFAHALEHMGQYPSEEARLVAGTLLPDVLPYDYTRSAGLPDSGRTLTDDAFDQALSVYLRRQVSDGVGPHTDLLAEFPYLGPPHQAATGAAVRR